MRAALDLLRRPGEAPDGEPQPTVADVGTLVHRLRGTGLDVTLRTVGRPRPLDRAVSLAAYRVVQEGLTNVVKHAGPDAAARVVLTWQDGRLGITVTDDGGSADPPPAPAAAAIGGHGLAGMRERVAIAGGDLAVGPDPESGGFTVRASLPARGADGEP
jgi:signal transduction histidine kinase